MTTDAFFYPNGVFDLKQEKKTTVPAIEKSTFAIIWKFYFGKKEWDLAQIDKDYGRFPRVYMTNPAFLVFPDFLRFLEIAVIKRYVVENGITEDEATDEFLTIFTGNRKLLYFL